MPHMEEHDILFRFPHSAAAAERDFGPKKGMQTRNHARTNVEAEQ